MSSLSDEGAGPLGFAHTACLIDNNSSLQFNLWPPGNRFIDKAFIYMYQLRALSGVVTTGQVCLHKQGLGRTVCPLKQFTRSRRVCHARGSAASRSSQGKSHSQQNSGDFWEKHTVQEKAQAAGQVAGKRYDRDHVRFTVHRSPASACRKIYVDCRVKQTYQAVEGGVKQAAKTVNSRFDLQRKAQKTRERYMAPPQLTYAVWLDFGTIVVFYAEWSNSLKRLMIDFN